MRAHAIRRRGLHILDEILALGEIAENVRAELLRHLLLLLAPVDGDDAEAHGLGVLARQRAQPSSGADDGDGLARSRSGLLEAFVDGDACAKDGSDLVEGHIFGDAGDVGGFADGVLLEGAVDGVAGEEGFGAERFVGLLAEVAGEAGAVEPLGGGRSASAGVVRGGFMDRYLDTGVVSDLNVLDQFPACYDDAGTFVAADKGKLGGQRPVTVEGV